MTTQGDDVAFYLISPAPVQDHLCRFIIQPPIHHIRWNTTQNYVHHGPLSSGKLTSTLHPKADNQVRGCLKCCKPPVHQIKWEGLTIRWSYQPLERLMELLKLVSELLGLVHSGKIMRSIPRSQLTK